MLNFTGESESLSSLSDLVSFPSTEEHLGMMGQTFFRAPSSSSLGDSSLSEGKTALQPFPLRFYGEINCRALRIILGQGLHRRSACDH